MSSTSAASAAGTDRKKGLQRLLAPCETHEFLTTYMGEHMLHVEGDPERWRDLFSWRDLNQFLNRDRVSCPRARLLKEFSHVDPRLYTYEVGGRQWLAPEACSQQMAQGATLIIDNVERSNSRLELFVRELEHDLQAEVHVDVVATFATVRGLAMHWDDSECFNIQLSGEKRWDVVRAQRNYPLKPTRKFSSRKDAINNPMPDGLPTWSGTMRQGDIIYLPRGWWHNVTPRAVPSLHLSISVEVPTASDFLVWFAQHATQHPAVRRAIPVWMSPEERRKALADALSAIESSLSVEAVEVFLAQSEVLSDGRVPFMLPQGASSDEVPLSPTAGVRLRSGRAIRWKEDGDVICFDWQGRRYQFNRQVIPALQRLDAMTALTLGELAEGIEPALVRGFVMTLIAGNIVSVTPDASRLS